MKSNMAPPAPLFLVLSGRVWFGLLGSGLMLHVDCVMELNRDSTCSARVRGKENIMRRTLQEVRFAGRNKDSRRHAPFPRDGARECISDRAARDGGHSSEQAHSLGMRAPFRTRLFATCPQSGQTIV